MSALIWLCDSAGSSPFIVGPVGVVVSEVEELVEVDTDVVDVPLPVAVPDAGAGAVVFEMVVVGLRLITSAATPPPIANATMTAAASSQGPPLERVGRCSRAGGCCFVGCGAAGTGPGRGCGLGWLRTGAIACGGWTVVSAVAAVGWVPVADGPPVQATTEQPPLSCQQSAWCAAAQTPHWTIGAPSLSGNRQ